jgi:sec-independent protein translocase protein TatA
MARSVGQSARIFKGEMKGMKNDGKSEKPSADAAAESVASHTAQPAALVEQPSDGRKR